MSDPCSNPQRSQAIDAAIGVLDSQLFKALQEPARVAVLRQLLLLGRADVGEIAQQLPQERSVISRHLQQLHEAGIVRVERAGRHRIYEVDGPALMRQFEVILHEMRKLAPFCCPGDGTA
ncbi:transcriptional regulator [Pseudomonas sp. WN033]|nr:transcriptional regulator [Pseudomonas sp. WN033]